jgi:ParB-like chromosome segregation protein Spo0J
MKQKPCSLPPCWPKGIPAHGKMVPPADLKPYPRNNKTHPDKQLAMLAKAIHAQGFRAPIVVSKQSGYIVRGHARREVAILLGLATVPVEYQEYPSSAMERADRIADNQLAELAEYDMAALKDELAELDVGDFAMDITGFDEGEIERMMTAAADVPEGAEREGKGRVCPHCGKEI